MPTRKFTAADLLPGRTYRVVAAFEDYDGRIHAVGMTNEPNKTREAIS
jgi:hypothetical protein